MPKIHITAQKTPDNTNDFPQLSDNFTEEFF